jgi:hypothetical protein
MRTGLASEEDVWGRIFEKAKIYVMRAINGEQFMFSGLLHAAITILHQ